MSIGRHFRSGYGEAIVKGRTSDGWDVVTTVEIIDGTNTFETRECGECGQRRWRHHDAEKYRREQESGLSRKGLRT